MGGFVKTLCGVLLLLCTFVSTAQAGSYIDNKDGTILDTESSLMWQQADDGTERVWSDAVKYCEELELAGYSDWRLPLIFRLEELIDPGQSPTINPLFSVKTSYYWSSSESRTSITSAKYVNFFYGNTYTYSKDNTYYALCVREATGDKATPLAADIKVTRGSSDLSAQFTALVSGGSDPFFHEWDFGDGDTSSLGDPLHEFPANGAYKIMLTVTDNGGSIAVSSQQILLPLVESVAEPVIEEDSVTLSGDDDGPENSDTPELQINVEEPDVAAPKTEAAMVLDTQRKMVDPDQALESEIGKKSTHEDILNVLPKEVDLVAPAEGGAQRDEGVVEVNDLSADEMVEKSSDLLMQGETDLAVFDAASRGVVPNNETESVDEKSLEQEQVANAESTLMDSVPVNAENSLDVAAVSEEAAKAAADEVVTDEAMTPEGVTAEAVTADAVTENAVTAEVVTAAGVIANSMEAVDLTVGTENDLIDTIGVGAFKPVIAETENVETPQEGSEIEAVETSKPEIVSEMEQVPAMEMPAALLKERVASEKRSSLQVFAGSQAPLDSPADIGYRMLAYTFANAFRGDADLNKDKKVTAYELKGYLNIAMESLSEGRQSPVISLEGDSFSVCSEAQNTYVFVVGANSFYQGSGSWPLATESAELVRKSIEDTCLKVKTISLSGEHANRQEVLRSLMQIKSMILPEDNLVLYFTGKSDVGSDGRLLFSLFDTVPEMSSLTGLYYGDVLSFIKTMPSAQVTMLLEADAPKVKN